MLRILPRTGIQLSIELNIFIIKTFIWLVFCRSSSALLSYAACSMYVASFHIYLKCSRISQPV